MSNLAKEILRRYYKAVRLSLSPSRRQEASNKAFESLIAGSDTLLSFSSFGSEIDLTFLNQKLALQKRLLLPRVENQHLKIYQVTDLQSLIPSAFGILEPDPLNSVPVNEKEIRRLLVPGLAFDNKKMRLGYGKGFYDLFLFSNPHLLSIGVGFIEQLHKAPLPQENHDIPLHSVLLF